MDTVPPTESKPHAARSPATRLDGNARHKKISAKGGMGVEVEGHMWTKEYERGEAKDGTARCDGARLWFVMGLKRAALESFVCYAEE